MDIVSILKWLDKGNNRWYDRDIDASMAYLHSFVEPENLWQRSFFQYKCNTYDIVLWKKVLMDIGAIIILPFILMILCVFGINVKFKKKVECVSDIVETYPIFPESLEQKYTINHEAYLSGYGLTLKDIIYLSKYLWTYYSKPFFLLHNIFKIARYSNVIKTYNPEVILCHNEASFSSSAITDYCRSRGVKLYNMMHGEKFLNIRNAFFEYDRCYVWHEHYKKLFIELRANPNQFVIELPAALRIDVSKCYKRERFSTYKYYLGGQSEKELKSIIDTMKSFKELGYSVKYRPHPRYSNMNDISKLLLPEEIEIPTNVDISVSIASTDFAIGTYSTVLLQAFYAGKGVLLDDITYKDRIDKQIKAKHMLMYVEGPQLLSQHIRDRKNNDIKSKVIVYDCQ